MSSSATADPSRPRAPVRVAVRVAVLLAHSPLRVEVDPLDGTVTTDERLSGLSDADQAALEWALRLGTHWSVPVDAVSVGPPHAAATLRAALAAGAASAVRAEADPDAPPQVVAAAAAAALAALPGAGAGAGAGGQVVLAGTWSPRRGSGAVPALVAAYLGAAQALGLVALRPGEAGVVEADRRLDGGRRERLRVRAPAVLSVDPGTAPLRRAGLPALLAARTAPVTVVPGGPYPPVPAAVTGPLHPRPKILVPPDEHAPARARILALTGAAVSRGGAGGGAGSPARTAAVLDPPAAAERILAALREWGYLPGPHPANAPADVPRTPIA